MKLPPEVEAFAREKGVTPNEVATSRELYQALRGALIASIHKNGGSLDPCVALSALTMLVADVCTGLDITPEQFAEAVHEHLRNMRGEG